MRFGDPERLKVGEWVVAIGSPFGFENSVTAGIVSAKGRSLPQENFVPFIQTDVAVNPGNSGGPLFNLRGEVVGINSQIYSRTGGFMGLSFAIPIDVANEIAQQLRTAGKVTRGRIGVVIQPLTKELVESFGLPKPQGALVNSVEKGGPAEKAGIEPGDVILRFDGKPVSSSEDLPRLVGATKPGSKVDRAGLAQQADARRAGRRRRDAGRARRRASRRAARDGGKPPAAVASQHGLTLAELTDAQRKELKIAGGVLVENAQGAAARAGVRRGDVITRGQQPGREIGRAVQPADGAARQGPHRRAARPPRRQLALHPVPRRWELSDARRDADRLQPRPLPSLRGDDRGPARMQAAVRLRARGRRRRRRPAARWPLRRGRAGAGRTASASCAGTASTPPRVGAYLAGIRPDR